MSEGKKLFFGSKIPDEIRALARLRFTSIERLTLIAVVSDVLASILEENLASGHLQEDVKNKLGNSDFLTFISGTHKLILLTLKSSISKEVLEEDIKELKLDPILSSAIVEVIAKKEKDISNKVSSLGPKLNTLKSLDWRVDVGISNSLLCKELQAIVTMKMLMSDGTAHVFEVPQKRFHELRFNVAMVLKEMELLENSRHLNIS